VSAACFDTSVPSAGSTVCRLKSSWLVKPAHCAPLLFKPAHCAPLLLKPAYCAPLLLKPAYCAPCRWNTCAETCCRYTVNTVHSVGAVNRLQCYCPKLWWCPLLPFDPSRAVASGAATSPRPCHVTDQQAHFTSCYSVTFNYSPFTSHYLWVTSHYSWVTSHHSPVTIHELPFTSQYSWVTIHQSLFMSYHSPVTIHESPVTIHESPVTTHQPTLPPVSC
jgi:hypothetical protein